MQASHNKIIDYLDKPKLSRGVDCVIKKYYQRGDRISWWVLLNQCFTELKQGDRTDRQIEYLNRYCVYDIDIAKIVMRTSIHHRNSREYWLMPVVSICSRAFNSLLERMISQNQWSSCILNQVVISTTISSLVFDLISWKESIKKRLEKDFEEFVNTFGLEVVLDPDSSYSQEQCMKWIQPLKNIISILAVKAGTRIELHPYIVSIQWFGKDVVWYHFKVVWS